MWTCPHCAQALYLVPEGRFWICSNKHQFDCAKQGYVNLLPSNRKRSREPGDGPLMIAARQRVHTAQVYQPLAATITELVAELDGIATMLDLGCGEGYYCNAICVAQPAAQLYAVDISRAAVKLAASAHKRVSFAVASTYQLPLPAASLELVLRVFAPSDDDELRRVLAPQGFYLEVTPAPTHLWELRELLYDRPRPHAPARSGLPGFYLQQKRELSYRMALNQPLLADLIGMTPFAHRGHREKRARLMRGDGLSVQMAFSLRLFQLAG